MTTTNKPGEGGSRASGQFDSETPFASAAMDSRPKDPDSQLHNMELIRNDAFYEHDDERTSPSPPDSDVAREELGEEPRSIILAMLSQVTKGMDLHRIAFPTFVLEPRSMLERITDFMTHPQLILRYDTFPLIKEAETP